MAQDELSFKMQTDIAFLKENITALQSTLLELDKTVAKNNQFVSGLLSQLTGNISFEENEIRLNTIQKLIVETVNSIVSKRLRGIDKQNFNDNLLNLPAESSFNVGDFNFSRITKGQILAELASALARITRRNL